jgi:probable rRNA maturation factor
VSQEQAFQLQIAPQWEQQVNRAPIVAAVRSTLHAEAPRDNANLTLVIVDDVEMARLNSEYREEEGTTDVLTFPYEDDGVDEDMAGYLGDVIICYEQAARQAADEGHSTDEELLLLAVHGTLHLLGYDDETPEEKQKMWSRQSAIMQELGIGHISP